MGAASPIFPNQFSTELVLVAAAQSFAFGFNAQYVRVLNLAAVPIHVNLGSTGNASTGDPVVRPGREYVVQDQFIGGGSVMTTSTTTSTDDTAHRVYVSAHG